MGQRFQVYVRYNKGQNIVAMDLQWCWGHYAVQRASQLLDYLKKNTADKYNYFMSENYAVMNNRHASYRILTSLIQMNLEAGSFVDGIDLAKETCEYDDEYIDADFFKINPFVQYNNDGILVIDVKEDEGRAIIKYCFDFLEKNEFAPISVKTYYERYREGDYADKDKWDYDDMLYFESLERSLEFVDRFELLTVEELNEIFDTRYSKDMNIHKLE